MFALLFIIAAALAYYYFVTNYEKKEKYTLDDERFDTSAYEEREAVVDHDLMEKLVLTRRYSAVCKILPPSLPFSPDFVSS